MRCVWLLTTCVKRGYQTAPGFPEDDHDWPQLHTVCFFFCQILVGGLEHEWIMTFHEFWINFPWILFFVDFFHNPNWRTHSMIFQRVGRLKPPTDRNFQSTGPWKKGRNDSTASVSIFIGQSLLNLEPKTHTKKHLKTSVNYHIEPYYQNTIYQILVYLEPKSITI